MIRHSSSFFISLVIHTFIAIALFYTYKSVVSVERKNNEKIELKLCCIVEKKDIQKPIEKPKEILKKIPLKPQPVKKLIPVVKEKIKKIEPVVIEEKQEIEKVVEPIELKSDIQEIKKEVISEKELSPETEYLDEHIKKITQLLQENLYYPRSARKRGITGEVVVKFKLSTDATVHDIRIESSTSDILSRAATKTIEDLSGEFPKPNKELTLHVPIKYSLSR